MFAKHYYFHPINQGAIKTEREAAKRRESRRQTRREAYKSRCETLRGPSTFGNSYHSPSQERKQYRRHREKEKRFESIRKMEVNYLKRTHCLLKGRWRHLPRCLNNSKGNCYV
ncbi:hypothetical protein CDAR_441351 [Caerostris darwini]|uniref:Uncharacterized protein n=1 Tax=Caerostris darwini TaxID=1538125 RepID=A0AAV4TTT3_9ARAC|nr:hypothetical protein CDAR_441351 [Caerostris darwini]